LLLQLLQHPKGIPSTTYKGFEFKFNDPIPLIKTFESSPGAPLFETIETPCYFSSY
jgi:hypothetical protein